MSLNSNALTSVDDVVDYMGHGLPEAELLSVYHDESDSATACSIGVAGSPKYVAIAITGGDNAGVEYFMVEGSSAYTTVTLLVAAINDADIGAVAVATATGSENPAGLVATGALNCFGTDNVQYLIGRETYRIEEAINAASDHIEKWCGRTFASTTYNQYLSGRGHKWLQLPQYPVTAVSRVAIGRQNAFTITNTSSDAMMATVAQSSSATTLVVVGGDNVDSDTVSYTAASTDLTTHIAAINAVGGGWSATIDPSADGSWLVADVLEFQAKDALNSTLQLYVPEETIQDYECNLDTGTLWRTNYGAGRIISGATGYSGGLSPARPWELHPLTAVEAGPHWPERMYNVYVNYTAGASTLPADVKRAANELAKNILLGAKRDGALSSMSIDGYSYSASGEGAFTKEIKDWLSPHRNHYHVQHADV